MEKPYCFIIPHGGYQIPEELAQLCVLNDLELFFEADTCANDLFDLHQIGTVIHTSIHRLFIDVDRDPYTLPPRSSNGVMKMHTSQKKLMFTSGVFPDEIAIAAMMKRYWFPFHNSIEHAVKSKSTRCIIVCHTTMPVAPPVAHDAGVPRPIIAIENGVTNGSDIITCEETIALKLLSFFQKAFGSEDCTVTSPFVIAKPAQRYIMQRYAKHKIPIIRVALSKSLFLNEKYFDPQNLSIDSHRTQHIQERLHDCFSKFARFI